MKRSLLLLIIVTIIGCTGPGERVLTIPLDENSRFYTGMEGAENLYLPPGIPDVYATDCAGNVYLYQGGKYGEIEAAKSLNLGAIALGIDEGPDGELYVAAAKDDWLKTGGAIYKVDKKLTSHEAVTERFPGINGLSFDNNGFLYFAVGNLDFWNPQGAIYRMKVNQRGSVSEPQVLLARVKSPNGMFFAGQDLLAYTETFDGVTLRDLKTKGSKKILGKTRLVEGFDDLTIDRRGNFWIADQPDGFIKMYRQGAREVVRFSIENFGVASSCRIRSEEGREFIYVTELKQSGDSKELNGRGFVRLSVQDLIFESLK